MAVSQRMWKREQERKRRERIKRDRRRRNCAIFVVLLAVVAVIAVIAINRPEDKNDKSNIATPPPNIQIDHRAVTDPYSTTREISEINKSFYADSAFAGNALAQTIGMYGILENTDFYANVNADVENIYEITSTGSTTSIAEQFKSKRFKKVFLAFGENELSKLSSSDFKELYKKFIEKIKEYQPDTPIYLIGIPPVTDDASNSDTNKITMQKVKEFNKRIMSIAVDNGLYYIDVIDALGDNKDFLPKGVSADGINLNKATVVDLLYYVSKEAYVPDNEDLANMEIEEEEQETENNEVPQTQDAQSSQPSPTVNVFKDSGQDKKQGE